MLRASSCFPSAYKSNSSTSSWLCDVFKSAFCVVGDPMSHSSTLPALHHPPTASPGVSHLVQPKKVPHGSQSLPPCSWGWSFSTLGFSSPRQRHPSVHLPALLPTFINTFPFLTSPMCTQEANLLLKLTWQNASKVCKTTHFPKF